MMKKKKNEGYTGVTEDDDKGKECFLLEWSTECICSLKKKRMQEF